MNFSDQYLPPDFFIFFHCRILPTRVMFACMTEAIVNLGVKNVDKYYPGLGVKYNSSLLIF